MGLEISYVYVDDDSKFDELVELVKKQKKRLMITLRSDSMEQPF